MKHVLKEIVANAFYFFQKALYAFFIHTQDKSILLELEEKGYFIINNYLSPKECEILIDEYNSVLNDSKQQAIDTLWQDDIGSDTRLYFAEKYSSKFKKALRDPYLSRIKFSYMGWSLLLRKNMLLINRIVAKVNNSGSGGGWHKDSPYSKQFKAIIYLTDVSLDSGPFQFIQGSHSLKGSLELYKTKILNGGQYRITESEIEKILNYVGCEKIITLTASKGTCILVNTKGIHRGMPINKGERVAMTYYFEAGHIKIL